MVSRADVVNVIMKDPARFPSYLTKKRVHNLSPVPTYPLARADVFSFLRGQEIGELPKNVRNFLRKAGALGDSLGVNVYVVGGMSPLYPSDFTFVSRVPRLCPRHLHQG